MSTSPSGTGSTPPPDAEVAAATDAQPGAVDVANAAAQVADLVQRTAPSDGPRVIHIAQGMSASTPSARATLEALGRDLHAALATALRSRGFTVSRNLAPFVPAGGDFAPVQQPEKLDPTPGWVVYFAISDAGPAAAPGRATVTYWTLKYDDYAKTGVFKTAGTKESLVVK